MGRDSSGRYTGCLLGGAIGDALGWPVEFDRLDGITRQFGPAGVTEPVPGENGRYEITDDTQLTLFTAEGLLRAFATSRHLGSEPAVVAALKRSYLCWLSTQSRGGITARRGEEVGWLLAVEGLHRRRAPGDTCLGALLEMKLDGNDVAVNDSKGCGGVMRAAPAGLLAARICDGDGAQAARLAFGLGCRAAALTHGHPSGHYPAGALAAVIAAVVKGETLQRGIGLCLDILAGLDGSRETAEAIEKAVRFSCDLGVTPKPQVVETLGEGWCGDEALAIGLYCSLAAGDDFLRGVRLAVNHSGDSDSTGSITGNLLGALLGDAAIPAPWLERLELAEVIRQVARDLYSVFEPTEAWLRRYPPVSPATK